MVVVSDLRPRCGGRWRWLTRAGAIKARRRPGLPPVRFRLRQRGPSDVPLLAVRLRPAPGSHRTGPRFRKWERPHRQTRPPGVQTFRSSRRKPVRVPCPRDAPRTPVVVADSPASTPSGNWRLLKPVTDSERGGVPEQATAVPVRPGARKNLWKRRGAPARGRARLPGAWWRPRVGPGARRSPILFLSAPSLPTAAKASESSLSHRIPQDFCTRQRLRLPPPTTSSGSKK